MVFVALASLSYAFLYLVPALSLSWLSRKARFRWFQIAERYSAIVMVLTTSITTLVLIGDLYLFKLYGFHMNGFVVNLVLSFGGVDSLGASETTVLTFLAVSVAILLIHALLWYVIKSFSHRMNGLKLHLTPRFILLVVLVLMTERFAYGVAKFNAFSPVMVVANTIPFYKPTSIRSLAETFGFDMKRTAGVTIKDGGGVLNYPLRPLQIQSNNQTPNIVWLVAESLRWDMLDSEIMPATWEFSQKNIRFENHYSSGNGTRMGLFGMFYGLPGNYWFSFLNQRRSPIVVDRLHNLDYQLQMFTSARFTYPEFDKTLFSGVPENNLHEFRDGKEWERDRHNVTQLLEFVSQRDKSRPFMTFMFFESPHARYHFPEESVIRQPYLQELNYATMDLGNDIGLIKNRYINASHHLDSQLARIIDYLTQNDLFRNTIVLITGDHGEEFMEAGRWGHNSQFTNEQIRVPFVLHVPGQSPQIYSGMSSHLDIPAMLMPYLGITNPPDDYSVGKNLLAGETRAHTIVADWNKIAFVDPEYKLTLPMKTAGMFQTKARTSGNDELIDSSIDYKERAEALRLVLSESSNFYNR